MPRQNPARMMLNQMQWPMPINTILINPDEIPNQMRKLEVDETPFGPLEQLVELKVG